MTKKATNQPKQPTNQAKSLAEFLEVVAKAKSLAEDNGVFTAVAVYTNTATATKTTTATTYTAKSLAEKIQVRKAYDEAKATKTTASDEAPLIVKSLADYIADAPKLRATAEATAGEAFKTASDRYTKAREALERAQKALYKAEETLTKAGDAYKVFYKYANEMTDEERAKEDEKQAKASRRRDLAKALAHASKKTAEGRAVIKATAKAYRLKDDEATDLLKVYTDNLAEGKRTTTGDEVADSITAEMVKALKKLVEAKA